MTLAPVVVLGASCALGGFERVAGDPPIVDAGTDQGCFHAAVPLPNLFSDGGQWDAGEAGAVVGPPEFVAALKVFRLQKTASGGALGLDLDRFCSCQGETPSCIPPPGQDPDLVCDQGEGRDNQAIALWRLMELVLLLEEDGLSKVYTEFAQLGRWSILLRVSGYNGLPNDDKVRVEWLTSGGMPTPPNWDGLDQWPINPSAYEEFVDAGPDTDFDAGTTTPRFVDNDGYVVDGKLVFSLAQGDLIASNGNSRLALFISDGTVMATIDIQPDGVFLRDGLIAGRIKQGDLFRMISEFRNHNGTPFCANVNTNPYWDATRTAFCRGPDIQVGPPSPNKKCDAVSIGLGFESEPALIGPTEPLQMPEGGTCAEGEDPYSVYLDAGCPQDDAAVPFP